MLRARSPAALPVAEGLDDWMAVAEDSVAEASAAAAVVVAVSEAPEAAAAVLVDFLLVVL